MFPFLSSSLLSLSRICGVLAHYKTEFNSLRQAIQTNFQPNFTMPSLSFPNGLERASMLNQYIWTLCQALWCQRLFLDTSTTSHETNSSSFLSSSFSSSSFSEKISLNLLDLSQEVQHTHFFTHHLSIFVITIIIYYLL
jgi:hypothetical protein